MRKPTETPEIFKRRRQRVTEALKGAALLVAAHPEQTRNDDVHHPYRQDSNMYYLTGFEEPESYLLIRPGHFPETVMFVREKNVERETWDGFRFGPEGTKKEFQIDEVYTIDQLESKTVELLKGFEEIYYRLYKNEEADKHFQSILLKLKRTFGRTGYGLLTVKDADTFLGEFRLKKDEADLANQKIACQISADAHVAAMKFTRPGVNEREVQAVLSYEFHKRGSARPGYSYIIASGASATTLHYNFNDQVCKDGDLLLIDAGAEYNYYSGDITRTFPVNGRFTEAQRKVYQGVLDIQKEIIASIKPGIYFKDLHKMGEERLTDLMFELGLLSGKKEDAMKANEHRKYYPHGIGHWLGMDVHDAGLYFIKGEARPLEPGMCFTIEPGLYIPADDKSAPAELRGIGVRIEDNVVVTANGCDNLTTSVPKEIDEIEKLMAAR
ncbi:aminopeptidase P family protein [Pseudobdellovibrio exovorus]|uniref:Xaa-Pro aminopeptidase n=1 Tax=Pseudobdellovibrio exovorus JSS TaxID=1184267 RepID=M4VER4_9BACT|nr:aminopeptidase P family protein [Pseudobdellovibrio exovorus]AGH96516.1 aminopeptidase P [Pseudobdellovibrio exovorus JSS]